MSAAPIADAALGGFIESPIDIFLTGLNSNPYFIGMMMLILNLGGRFYAMEMTKSQEAFFMNPWIRRSLIYVIIFIGTRNVLVALLLGTALMFVLGFLFNESSSLCIWKVGVPGSTCAAEPFKDNEKENENDDEHEKQEEEQQQGMAPPMTQPLQPGGLTKEEQTILQTLQAKAAGGSRGGGILPQIQELPKPTPMYVPQKSMFQRYVENMRKLTG